ncbi:carboxymuconolactone decarboxylase family protein [Microbacterium immunditiarum]|uniref:Alkylhydroperoxidase family enzyme n=1 Tax=Microbacterium immunditiarum TaxID=337480 RepID=A0A7Y9GKV9_9MICO|nr:carboxymuconolactone decarboxylase family protein [Microbacterium immunditiarum]NYE18349.1 alkylhydroperoxidase family enzyme [Microbacterium immunditiarum]
MARIPLDHDRGLSVRALRALSRRRFGKVIDPGLVAAHHPGVLNTMYLTEMGAARWRKTDATLQALAVMRTAAVIGCSWCMDFGYWEYHHRGVDPAKLRAVPDWQASTVFSPLERAVLEYADAMTATPPAVTDELVDRLRGELTDAQVVELTALIALENQRSRTNAAMGLTSQGFKDQCELPAAAPSTEAVGAAREQ